MLNDSFLKNQISMSPLSSSSTLRPKGQKAKRPLLFTLTLTSLIDAFSILVIFLLSNYSTSSQPINLDGKIQLPMASKGSDLNLGTVIRVSEGHFYIEDREVAPNDMPKRLFEIKHSAGGNTVGNFLIIQADKKIMYESLSPIILAGSHAGFEKFSFAVLQSGGSGK